MSFFVYILECADGSYYCGYTDDLKKRVEKHNRGVDGAKYTRSRRPVRLVYSERLKTKPDALKREHKIKNMNRAEKESLMDQNL